MQDRKTRIAAFLLATGILMLALGLVSYVSSMRDHANDEVRAAISGSISPAIVISIILTLVFYFLR